MTFVTRRLLPSGQVQQHRMLETAVALFGGAPSRSHLVSAGWTDSGVVVSRVRVGWRGVARQTPLTLDIRRLLVVVLCPDSV